MKRVLLLGGDGLLGSHLYLALRDHCALTLTLHGSVDRYPPGLFSGARVEAGLEAGDWPRLERLFAELRPNWVLNAIGLVKRDAAADPCASLLANTLLPHRLADLCARHGGRLLQFSTDCVFSGARGAYRENDLPDNPDWHGRCKALGEPVGEHVLVLRTSFIGLELGCRRSLLDWFLAHEHVVHGYRKARWSGFSVHETARLTRRLIDAAHPLHGTWHVAGTPISKYELLTRLAERLPERRFQVVPDDSFVCDRTLDGSAFAARTGYTPPDWDDQLDELVADIRRRWRPDSLACWI